MHDIIIDISHTKMYEIRAGYFCPEMEFRDIYYARIVNSNKKVIGSDVHTSVNDKRDDFGFPIINFP